MLQLFNNIFMKCMQSVKIEMHLRALLQRDLMQRALLQPVALDLAHLHVVGIHHVRARIDLAVRHDVDQVHSRSLISSIAQCD